jgi:hypothetical protein
MAKEKQTDTVLVDKGLVINAIKVIDAAAERGAFKGGELSTVGQVRDMLYMTVSDEIKGLVPEDGEEKQDD